MSTNRHESNIDLFFKLVRAGLWGDVKVNGYRLKVKESDIDWGEIMRLAEEQAVVGLVAAGIDRFKLQVPGFKIPQEWALQFIGQTLQIEQQNKAMNEFVAKLIELLRKNDIYAILVKGQGIAQCYERPLWRASGDVDLLLSDYNYRIACDMLGKIADSAERETAKNAERKHQEYQIDSWTVELHGTMHTSLSKRIDKGVDNVQGDVFCGGNVRSWQNGNTQVFLPRADEDVIFVFTHILQHLFLEGIGLRQVCDWCRLLYTFRNSLDYGLLESRIKRMGLMSEWRVFAALAVQHLGMPEEAMPMFGSSVQAFKGKAKRLMDFIMEVGNFGHNREVEWSNDLKRRTSLIWHRITDTFRLTFVFPYDAPKFLMNYALNGVKGILAKSKM